MKVLHLTHHFWPCIGGIERFVLDLSEALNKMGIESDVMCLDSCANGKKLEQFGRIGLTKIERNGFINLKYYKISPHFALHLKNYDLVHVHSIGFFLDFAVLTKFFHKKRIVLNTHGGIFHTKKLGFLKKIYFNFWLKHLLNGVDRVIADSVQDFELFSKIVPTKKIALIENGVNLEDYCNSEKEKIPNTFVFVGRFSKNKRIDLLIEAFAQLPKGQKNWVLKIVGEDFDNLKPKLAGLIEQKGLENNIKIIERLPQNELAGLLAKSQFFASASEYEGFGISAIEAMASQCIPILNKIDGFSTLIEESNQNGFLAEFENPKKTAQQLSKIMQLGKKELEKLQAGCLKTTERFSLDKVLQKYIVEYENIAK